MTTKGDCDRAYRYPVAINGTSLVNAGDAAFDISGKVQGNGAITVKVSYGEKSAMGSGPPDQRLRHRLLDRRLLRRHLDRRAPARNAGSSPRRFVSTGFPKLSKCPGQRPGIVRLGH